MAIDKITAIFFFLLSIFVCIESYRLNLGAISNPKAGLFPFISGVLLGFFSFLGFFNKMPWTKAFKEGYRKFVQWKFQKVLSVLIILFAYASLLKTVGFLISTFLLVFFTYEVVGIGKIKRGILIALISTIASYLLFQIVLKAQLPKGFLGI